MIWRNKQTQQQAAHLQAGALAERAAERYLLQHGLNLVQKNYRARRGEIDLIMRHQAYLVFIEVRYRRSGNYGGALASVTVAKQKKLISAASEFLLRYKIPTQQACRFDVICVEGKLTEAKIHWIPNAFDLSWTGA
jgi:putative endonuclease